MYQRSLFIYILNVLTIILQDHYLVTIQLPIIFNLGDDYIGKNLLIRNFKLSLMQLVIYCVCYIDGIYRRVKQGGVMLTLDQNVLSSNSTDASDWALRTTLVTRVPVAFNSNKIKHID